jgi:hypothetical protein
VTDSLQVEVVEEDSKEVIVISNVGISDEMIYEAVDSGVQNIKPYIMPMYVEYKRTTHQDTKTKQHNIRM